MEDEKLFEALKGLLNIIDDSTGVDGYHYNGEVALWDEFEEVDYAKQMYKEWVSQKASNENGALPIQHVANELKEAASIIQHLKAYGMINPVRGVVYPEGTHDEFIRKADKWLWRFHNGG